VRTTLPEKLGKILQEIGQRGWANETKLTVLRKWFEEKPDRLSSFALFIAKRASGSKTKRSKEAAQLMREARALLKGLPFWRPKLPRQRAIELFHRLRDFQNEYEHQRWVVVRLLKDYPLFLIEEALRIYLGAQDSPSAGYGLAARYCKHYDPRYGTNLNGPAKERVQEIKRFVSKVEKLEGE
jgi:hypothetical protein